MHSLVHAFLHGCRIFEDNSLCILYENCNCIILSTLTFTVVSFLFLSGPIINSEAIVDSVIELWIQSKKKLCQELKKLIHSSFNDHPDPYTLLIAFLNRVGK